MPFKFNESKALQAVSLLLKMAGGTDDYMRTLKLLYFAERRSLKEFGYPITGDEFYAVRKGPILSETLNLMKGESWRSSWENYIRPGKKYSIELIADPGTDMLTPYEIESISAIWEELRHLSQWELSDRTHELPEWLENKPHHFGRKPIVHERLLKILGWDDDEASEIIADAAN